MVSLFDTLTNHSLTIYYNLIYSLSASWPAAEEKGQRGGAGTPKGLIPILPVLSPKNTTAANAAAAHALVRADKSEELVVERQVTGSPPSLLAAHRREKAKLQKA